MSDLSSMVSRRLPALLIAAAVVAGDSGAARSDPSAKPPDALRYVIQKDDTLRMLAIQHYAAPSAADAIFFHNIASFKTVYERNKRANRSFDATKNPFSSKTIFPDTIIELPTLLRSARGRLYQRRGTPITPELAHQIAVAQRVDLAALADISRRVRPVGVHPPPPPAPLSGYANISKALPPVKREAPPRWFTSPTTDMDRCAVAVCTQYRSLCYYECRAVARRFDDGDVVCANLPSTLPYELDTGDPDRCVTDAP